MQVVCPDGADSVIALGFNRYNNPGGLSRCGLTGSGLSNLRLLSQLQALDLGGNHIGNISSDFFVNSSFLTFLDLHDNHLRDVPPAICRLGQLTELYLDGNRISVLPECIPRQMKKLEILYLSRNELRWLPQSLGDLQHLIEVQLSSNQLQTLPPSFSR